MELIQKIKAWVLNHEARGKQSKPDLIIQSLSLKSGDRVADIGAGGGYFAMEFAGKVGSEGKVFAVENDRALLKELERILKTRGIENVEAVHTKGGVPNLPHENLDLLFFRDVYHHLDNRLTYFTELKQLLKPSGRVAIIDYLPATSIFQCIQIFGHHMPPHTIEQEMGIAGYAKRADFDFLPRQSFMIFAPQNGVTG
jgi:ubiquinone/menaquinone biosynthesis C-methylase UbiE